MQVLVVVLTQIADASPLSECKFDASLRRRFIAFSVIEMQISIYYVCDTLASWHWPWAGDFKLGAVTLNLRCEDLGPRLVLAQFVLAL